MISWLIHLFSGATKEEYLSLNQEYNSQRELVQHYRAREEQLISQLNSEKEERKRLQEIIFKKFNILPEENGTGNFDSEQDLKPIKTSPRRWSELRNALEDDDRQRARNGSDSQRTRAS